MKRLFDLIAGITLLSGLVNIVFFAMTYNLVLLFSAIGAFLGSYVWGIVGDMWENIERLSREIDRIKEKV